MSHANKVLRSINYDGETICVDIFRRPDGTFGFDEFRRDFEDGKGWFVIGFHGHHVFATEQAAMSQALKTIAWLKGAL
ncbi:MAG: hypothetical protein COC12_04830 [Rhodobacteraceae bacterium]|nr:MAG: hypothetical protein COC12_04830 [Paracoccaceae bacterium]